MIVTTGSRLHFGLYSLSPPDPSRSAARNSGGVGLMIQRPSLSLSVAPAAEWSASGPQSDRVMSIVRALEESSTIPHIIRPLHVDIASCPPAHVGLGTGTQFALAVGAAVLRSASSAEI